MTAPSIARAMSPLLARRIGQAQRRIVTRTTTTLSMRWLSALLERTNHQEFGDLLRALSPRAYRRLRKKSTRHCYIALISYLGNHKFPVWETAIDYMEEDAVDDNGDYGFYEGIPFACQGIDPYDGPIESPAIALCWQMFNTTNGNFARESMECLQPYHDRLIDWLPVRQPETNGVAKLPIGRAFIKPWQAAGDLFRYANNATDNPFLDYSSLAQQEQMAYPAWNIDEVRGLTRAWKEAQPLIKRIDALQAHIDAQPAERLRQLSAIIRNDPVALKLASRPVRLKTLADVFTRARVRV